MFDISNRLQDVVTEIDLHHETLMDKNLSERNKSQSLKKLKGTIRRYLASSSLSIAVAATQLSPIVGIPCVSKVKEREKKNAALGDAPNPRKSPALLMLESSCATKDVTVPVVKSRKQSGKRKNIKNCSILSKFPPPSDGKECGKRETFDMLSKFDEGSSERSALIDELTSNR